MRSWLIVGGGSTRDKVTCLWKDILIRSRVDGLHQADTRSKHVACTRGHHRKYHGGEGGTRYQRGARGADAPIQPLGKASIYGIPRGLPQATRSGRGQKFNQGGATMAKGSHASPQGYTKGTLGHGRLTLPADALEGDAARRGCSVPLEMASPPVPWRCACSR